MNEIKVMHWIERHQENGGMCGNTPHWNRILGHAREETAREDMGGIQERNPSERYRLVRVTEEVLP